MALRALARRALCEGVPPPRFTPDLTAASGTTHFRRTARACLDRSSDVRVLDALRAGPRSAWRAVRAFSDRSLRHTTPFGALCAVRGATLRVARRAGLV